MEKKFPLKYEDYKDITLEMLNKEYGDKGRTFALKEDAEREVAANPGSYLYKIMNYRLIDVVWKKGESKAKVKDGASKYLVAYLVTYPRERV